MRSCGGLRGWVEKKVRRREGGWAEKKVRSEMEEGLKNGFIYENPRGNFVIIFGGVKQNP